MYMVANAVATRMTVMVMEMSTCSSVHGSKCSSHAVRMTVMVMEMSL